MSGGIKIIANNKNARREFEIGEIFEAGIVLRGTEVKSLREGKANLKESHAQVKDGEVWLYGMHISPYSHASMDNHDPIRARKLLLHKSEIRKLIGKIQEKGFTLVPIKLYFKKGLAKVELGLGKGKKLTDKREDLKRKDMNREIQREMAQRY